MLHEHHTSHENENQQDNFWTHIPEGGDMLPGMMPDGMSARQMDDLYPTGHHATQQDEYGTGIDPHGPDRDLVLPGDAPEEQPDIQARGDGSGMADWDGADSTQDRLGDPNHLPGNYGRTAANAPDDAQNNAQDNTQDCGGSMGEDCRR